MKFEMKDLLELGRSFGGNTCLFKVLWFSINTTAYGHEDCMKHSIPKCLSCRSWINRTVWSLSLSLSLSLSHLSSSLTWETFHQHHGLKLPRWVDSFQKGNDIIRRKQENPIFHFICFHISSDIFRPPQWLSSRESSCNAGDAGDANSIPGSGRSW